MVLEPYEGPKIQAAFKQWMTESSTMPTPADIVKLIDPPKEKLSGLVYNRIKEDMKKDTFFLSKAEREYLAAYEKQEMDKAK